MSPLTGKEVQVIAAGGIFNGQSLAAALMLGASAVWVGTRFVLSDEAGAPKAHQEAVRTAGFDDNVKTLIFTVSFFAPFYLSWYANWVMILGPSPPSPHKSLHPKLGREPTERNQRAHGKRQDPRRARYGGDG